tara:strand:- start:4456 stop:4920 length:465 start_codon:yes stop_codon:yes gene_type:complete
MIFEIKSNNSDQKAFQGIYNIERGTKSGIHQAFINIKKDLVRTSKILIRDEVKNGIVYKYLINGKRVSHISSSGGQSPAFLTGALFNSIGATVSGGSSMEFGAGDGNEDMTYARYLEDGTKKMAKRPYLIRSINLNERNNYVSLQDKIEKELSK